MKKRPFLFLVASTMHTLKRNGQLISLQQARTLVAKISPLGKEIVGLKVAVQRILAKDVIARSDCPSADVSLKDGYAVASVDIESASATNPVRLEVLGVTTAGEEQPDKLAASGTAVRIMTGAQLPPGADAVLASEFAQEKHGWVQAYGDARVGRNILRRGADVQSGHVVVASGTLLQPSHLGLLAAAGVNEVEAYRVPRVVVVATGSELVAPGEPIGSGMVAASNMVTLVAELEVMGISADSLIIKDDLDHLTATMAPLLDRYDVVLTCGGVLDGDKDFTLRAMDELGVDQVFHRVRVGPGKGISMGRLNETLIFNLPGGPPSNHVAFLLLALPGIRKRGGNNEPFSGRAKAVVTLPLKGRSGWTQIIYGRVIPCHQHNLFDSQVSLQSEEMNGVNGRLHVEPIIKKRRLQAMAAADCLIEIAEDMQHISAGATGTIWKIR